MGARGRHPGRARRCAGAARRTTWRPARRPAVRSGSTGGTWARGRPGPSPHFHRSITESFFVLSGTVRLHDGRRWIDAGPGRLLPRARSAACTASGTSRGSRRRCSCCSPRARRGRTTSRPSPTPPGATPWARTTGRLLPPPRHLLGRGASRGSPAAAGRARRCGPAGRSGSGPPGSGHHHVTRSCVGGPCSPSRIAVPHRRQGLPRRPNTQWSRPRRGSPVVFCSGWCRLARMSVRARSTSAGRSFDVGDPRPRVDAADEQRLDLVEIADPGQVALVEDRDADLLVGVLARAGAAPRRGPSRGRGRRARGGRRAGPPRRWARRRCRAAGSPTHSQSSVARTMRTS